jgi:hypothetical protein
VLERLGQSEASTGCTPTQVIFNGTETLRETVKGVEFLDFEACRITMKILFIFLLSQGVGLHQAAEGFLLELLLHLHLTQVEQELICTFDLTACLFNYLFDLLNGLRILIRSTGKHICENIGQFIVFLGLSE